MKAWSRSGVLALIIMLNAFPLCAEQNNHALQALIDSGQLLISQKLQAENVVPGQEVNLAIEIRTNRWFAGGTQLKPQQSDDILVIQRQELATNSTEQKDGATWVVQLWELSLFPQREGLLFTPPIAVTVKINTEQGIIEGTQLLPAMELNVATPEELQAVDNWIATPSLTVTRNFNKPLDGLQAGDAFTMTIELRADNVLAMMLPEIKMPAIEGLAIYPQSPELRNESNRGNKIALRKETINFVVEQNGTYQLPAINFYWWNTQTNSLQQEQLQALTFSSAGAKAPGDDKTITPEKPVLTRAWLIALLVLLLIAAGVLLAVRTRQSSKPTARKVRHLFDRALKNRDYKLAIRWAYYWLDHYGSGKQEVTLLRALAQLDNAPEGHQQQALEDLFAGAFAAHSNKPAEIELELFTDQQPTKSPVFNPQKINP